MKLPLFFLITFALGLGAGWWLIETPRHQPSQALAQPTRRVRFYQSPMHPWIKSDQPGRCTLCGMELSPVYEGDSVTESAVGWVTLGSNSIQLLHLDSTPVERAPITRTLRLSGVLKDNDQAHRFLAATVDARIDFLGIKSIGQDVQEGQVLARIFSPMLLAAEREFTALNRQKTSSPTNLTFDSLITATRQRLLQMGLSRAQIDALPSKSPTEMQSEILAPYSGTVVVKKVFVGQYVKEGEILFELADFSSLWAQLDAYESDLPWLELGQSVTLQTPSIPGRFFEGKIEFIDPNFDALSRSTRIRVTVQNPWVTANGITRRLLSHRISLSATLRSSLAALSVPRSAVLRGGPVAVAYVDHGGGSFERRVLQIGSLGDDRIEILSGLAEGESVVRHSAFLLDAQTELNGLAQSTSQGTAPLLGPNNDLSFPPLNPILHQHITSFLKEGATLSENLAADDFTAFKSHISGLKTALATLQLTESTPALLPIVTVLSKLSPVQEFKSIEAARAWFVPFSDATTDLATEILGHGSLEGIHLFVCPMVDKAVSGSPKKSRWIQNGIIVRNPFFGAKMLDCGLEVKVRP